MNAPSTSNNFDLLRLVAALQVATLHVVHYISPDQDSSHWISLLEIFSGVPIFFFISGFLISRSYERSKILRDYAFNRTLRIFPALHVCVFLNIIAVAATGYFYANHTAVTSLALLYLAKTTFFQFYNPQFMRGFGDGVLNGSLWTICVELQFYLVVPLIYRAFITKSTNRSNAALVGLLLVSLLCNRALYGPYLSYAALPAWKLARVSFLPWIYMFLTGVLAQRNFGKLRPHLTSRNLAAIFVAYTVYALLMQHAGVPMDNRFSPLVFFPLAALILSAAYYSAKPLRNLLRGNDVSYGIYIYHVPVMNMFLYYGLTGSFLTSLLVLLITAALAVASWFLVERPCLRHKHHPSHAITAS